MAIADHIKKDSPTNNFATFNPLHLSNESTPDIATLSDGNLVATVSSSTCAFSNFQIPKTGKWFAEVLLATDSSPQFGIGNVNAVGQGASAGYYGIYNNGSSIILHNGSHTTPASSGAWSPDDVNEVGLIAIDSDNNKIWLGVNTNASARASPGLYIGNSTSDAFDNTYPTIGENGYDTSFDINDGWFINVSGGGSSVWVLNCGQDPTFGGRRSGENPSSGDGGIGLFHTVPPTGFKALCTANLPDFTPNVADDNPEDYFKAVLYTADDSDTNEVTVGFVPDLCWFKDRYRANYHTLIDSVRGGDRHIYSHDTQIDRLAGDGTDGILDFNSGGTNNKIKIGFHAGWGFVNASDSSNTSNNYVLWAWKAAGSAASSGNANLIDTNNTYSSPTIASLVSSATNAGASNVIAPSGMSINQQSGFSIIKATSNYTSPYPDAVGTFNNTVPHGLNIAPEFVIAKNLDDTQSWIVFHKHSQTSAQIAAGKSAIVLNTAAVLYTNTTGVTLQANDKVIPIGKDVVESTNESFICYAWHSVPGYSAFGSYAGNGDNDNDDDPDPPFIYTGFSPAFVWIKSITHGTRWYMYDNVRSTSNVNENPLSQSEATAEANVASPTSDNYKPIDLLSNGFKIRNDRDQINKSGESYLYCAWAEQPTKFANAR